MFRVIKALISITVVGVCLSFMVVLGFILTPFVVLTAKRQSTHPIHYKGVVSRHTDRYKSLGSSGVWHYVNSGVPFLKWWNNYEDGLLGEPSGKWSATCKGKEKSFINMVKWNIRNPFNYGKRTLLFFHCKVNDCDVSYIGDKYVSDKESNLGGWYIVRAKQKEGVWKRTYYGIRWVKHYKNNKVRQLYIGFKLKPEHQWIEQSLDDSDKAFTTRLPFLKNKG